MVHQLQVSLIQTEMPENVIHQTLILESYKEKRLLASYICSN